MFPSALLIAPVMESFIIIQSFHNVELLSSIKIKADVLKLTDMVKIDLL